MAASALLAGCAQYAWFHPKSGVDGVSDQLECRQDAFNQYPPALYTYQAPTSPQPAYRPPTEIDCRSTGYNTATCTATTPPPPASTQFQPAPIVSDARAAIRAEAFSYCMRRKGWEWKRVN
jgi:hypothetical protein